MRILAEVGGQAMGPGESVLFWVLAPLIVAAASCLLFVKRAVYAAVALAGVMIGLAFFYVACGAPFLGVAQVVVYTGAIMMLFVFVLMLVGIDSVDSPIEVIRGHRVVCAICGLGLASLLGGVIARTALQAPLGIADPGPGGNPKAVATVIFEQFPFTLEVVGTLLIVAAVGAVMLTHRVRMRPREGQKELSIQRIFSGGPVAPPPAPGVVARHNAVDIAAVDAQGRAIDASVPEVLRARGQVRDATPLRASPAQATRPDPAPPTPTGGEK